MKLSLLLPTLLAASGVFATVASEHKAPTTNSLRANANAKQDARRANRYWVTPIQSVGLTCIDNSIRAGGGKPTEICITEGEALCIEYDYKPMGGRWQFGIMDSKLRLYDPKGEIAYEYGTDVSHLCIGEEHGFDPNRYSKERPYMTLYNEKTHEVVGSLTCDGTDGGDDENIGQSTMLKLVDQADIGQYATYPLTIVKFKKGQTEDPEDDNMLWNIVVGDYPTTIARTGDLSALYGLVNFNTDKCEWIAFVDTFQELQRRIAMATDPTNPAKIEISNIRPIVFEDIIDISNKYFEISCPDSDCVFDLNGYSFVTPDNGEGSPFHVEFDGMAVKNGSSNKGRDDVTYNTFFGGAFMLRGITPTESTLILNDCTLRNNVALSDSGVINSIGASIVAADSIFENNESGRDGGAIWTDTNSSFKRCRFTANAAVRWGGALTSYEENNAIEIQHCNFEDNEAVLGGALYVEYGVTTIDGAIFSSNSGSDGGAVFALSATVNLQNCNFDKNAAVRGGAIFSKNSSSSIDNCNFVENSASEWGGAVIGFDTSVDFLTCEFDSNNALASGGAVFLIGGSSTSTFNKCHFSENEGVDGGAMLLLFGASTTIDSCRFGGNIAHYGGAISTYSAETEIVGGTKFECNSAALGGAILNNLGSIDISGVDFTNNQARWEGGALLMIDSADSSIEKSFFDQNVAVLFEAGAIYYSFSSGLYYGSNTINGTVFQNNTSPSASDDIFSRHDIQCGAGYGNCFCDADASPLVAPNITTNDLPSTCSGSDVGSCSGCLPSSSSTCSATSRADLITRTGSESFEKMDMNDMHAMLEDKMKSMGQKMGEMEKEMGVAMKGMAEKKAEKKSTTKNKK